MTRRFTIKLWKDGIPLRLKLLPKLMLSLSILGIILTISLAFFGYSNTKSYLEDM